MGRKKNSASELDAGQKLLTPLAQRLSALITDTNKLKEYLGCSVQAINQYKLGTSRPSLDNLCKIAEFYHVSTDYLLGRTDTSTTDTEYRAVETFTGLSNHSIRWLHLNRKEEIVQILNALMEHTDFRIALSDIIELKHTAPLTAQDSCIFPPPIEKRSDYVMINRETYTDLLEYKITEAFKRAFMEIGYSDLDFSAVIGKELID